MLMCLLSHILEKAKGNARSANLFDDKYILDLSLSLSGPISPLSQVSYALM